MSWSARSLLPSISFAVVALLAVGLHRLPFLSGDLGWHLRVGQRFWETGAVPRAEFMTFTAPGHLWVTHEWLAAALFALVERAGGFPALLFTRGAASALLLVGLYRLGRRAGAAPIALPALLLLAGATVGFHTALRPWIFTNLLLLASLLAVERLEGEGAPGPAGWLAFWPIAIGLWVNLHGGFVVGVALGGLAALRWGIRARRWGPPALAGAATIVATLVNPHGLDAALQPLHFAFGAEGSETGLALVGAVDEWGPLALRSPMGALFVGWVALAAAAIYATPRALLRPAAPLGLAFLLMSLGTRRHLPVAAILLTPLVCRGLLGAPLVRRLAAPRGRLARSLAGFDQMEAIPRGPLWALGALGLALHFASSARAPGAEAERLAAGGFPLAAAQALNDLPGERLFNHYGWSGLVAWKAPDRALFITAANESYPREVFADWLAIARAEPGWRERAARWQIDSAILPADGALSAVLRDEPGWRVAWEDERAVIFTADHLLE